jgi:hypothetical protein
LALYVPQARRRRRTLSLAAATAIVGLAAGGVLGRVSAPTVSERVAAVRADARDTASGLRVISLHGEAGVDAAGAGGADLVLKRTGEELAAEFDDAPWLAAETKKRLLTGLAELKALPDHSGARFGDAAAALAQLIEDTFNGRLEAAPVPAPTPSPSPAATADPTADPSASPTPTATAVETEGPSPSPTPTS